MADVEKAKKAKRRFIRVLLQQDLHCYALAPRFDRMKIECFVGESRRRAEGVFSEGGKKFIESTLKPHGDQCFLAIC
jgi:hypothetical protein